jgi:hypothetical protein
MAVGFKSKCKILVLILAAGGSQWKFRKPTVRGPGFLVGRGYKGLGLFALIGIVLLMGLVTKNSILLMPKEFSTDAYSLRQLI